MDTSEWKKYNKEAEDLAVQLKKQVDDALKQSAQIRFGRSSSAALTLHPQHL